MMKRMMDVGVVKEDKDNYWEDGEGRNRLGKGGWWREDNRERMRRRSRTRRPTKKLMVKDVRCRRLCPSFSYYIFITFPFWPLSFPLLLQLHLWIQYETKCMCIQCHTALYENHWIINETMEIIQNKWKTIEIIEKQWKPIEIIENNEKMKSLKK